MLKTFLFSIILLFFQNLQAANSLSYSGRLVQTSGAPVNGPVDLRAELVYTNATSTILCSQNLSGVSLTKGVFHLKLDLNCAPKTLSQVLSETPNGESVAMRIIDQTNSKSYPLQAIHSVPFSKVAEQLLQMGASTGQALAWDGTKWAPTAVGTGNGTVTNIITGTGLTGGPISTTGTISIANSGVGTTQIADGAVSNIKISDVAASKITGTLSGSQIGAGVLDQSHLSATANIPYSKLSINDGDIPAIKIGGLQSAIDNIIASVITNGDTTHAPSGDVVYDALQLKFDKAGGAINPGGTLTGLPALPLVGSEATSKDYVDNQIASITSGSAANQWDSSAGNVYRTSGNVGIGTDAPNGKLEVVETSSSANRGLISTQYSSDAISANNQIRKARGTPSAPMAILAGDIIGNYNSLGYNGTTFGAAGSLNFVAEENFTATNHGSYLMFRTSSLGTNINTEKMRLTANGYLGVGTDTPTEKLHVAGNINADGKLRLKSDNTNYVELSAQTGLAANLNYIFPGTAGTNGQVLTTNGSGVLSWSTVATTATTVGGDISGTIANAEIAAGAVGSTEIADASIVTADLADSSVTSAKIVDGTITDSDIANNTITYGKLNLANGSVPLLKLEGTRDGTKYLKGDNTWSTLATDVINSVLSGFTVASGTKPTVANGDSIVGAFGKVQKTLNDIDADYVSKSGNNTVTGSFNLTGIASYLQIPTPTGAVVNEAANVQYVKNYVDGYGQWTKNVNDIYYNTGNVGIGTSSPTQKLDVSGSVKATAFIGDGSGLTGISAANLTFYNYPNGYAGGVVPFSGMVQGVTGFHDYHGTAVSAGSTYWAGITTKNSNTGAQFALNWDTNGGLPSGFKVRAKDDNLGDWSAWRNVAFVDATVNKAGDTMTGALNLPSNGLAVGTNQLVVSGGNVGIGTTTPTSLLNAHVNTSTYSQSVLRVQQGGSFAAMNDYVANIHSYGNRSALGNGTQHGLYVQAGWDADANGTEIARFSALNGGYADIPRMVVKSNGNVGIGTTTPSEKLEVTGNVKATEFLYSSDERLKHDIRTLSKAIDKVLKLRGVEFKWNKNDEKTVGFIAQEVEKVLPELVKTDKYTSLKSVQYGNLVALLVEALKEENQSRLTAERKLSSTVEKMQSEMKKLENENIELKKRLDKIEKYLNEKR